MTDIKSEFSDLFGSAGDNMILPSITMEPSAEMIPIQEVKKKKTRRKRCDKCDSMLAKHIYDDPEKHACIRADFQPAAVVEEPVETVGEEHIRKYEADVAAKNLYNLQFTVYFMIENALQSAGRHDMDGLTGKMEGMKDQYLHVFEQVYEEHGSEFIDEVLSPTILWGILTTQNIATTYIDNKKKE